MGLVVISQNIKSGISYESHGSFPAEFQVRVGRLEAEIKERSTQVDALTAQLEETQVEKSQLVQQLASINSLLEASQSKKEEENNQVKHI